MTTKAAPVRNSRFLILVLAGLLLFLAYLLISDGGLPLWNATYDPSPYIISSLIMLSWLAAIVVVARIIAVVVHSTAPAAQDEEVSRGLNQTLGKIGRRVETLETVLLEHDAGEDAAEKS